MPSDTVTNNAVLEWDTADDSQEDWGDFSSVLSELSSAETPALESDTQQTNQSQAEAMTGFVDVAFVVIEQVTSMLSGVEFEFDEAGKQKVLAAAVPVLNKHGNQALALFGSYVEEATLLVALLALVFSAKKTLQQKKLEALKHGEETQTADVS